MGEKKYLLFRPKYFATVASVEPLGLEYLAAVLEQEKKGYEILDEFVHPYLFRWQRLVSKIKKNRDMVICFSTTVNKAHYILKLAKQLKALFPSIVIMVGGSEPSLNPADFHLDYIDVVYHDHGLESFQTLVKNDFAKEKMVGLAGVDFQDQSGWQENPAGAPISAYHVAPNRDYFYQHQRSYYIVGKGNFALLKTSFSCPQACNFCVSRKLNGGSYQECDIKAVVNEIESIRCDKIWIIDDDFLANKERAEKISQMLLQRGIKKIFLIFARADCILANEENLPLLHEAGFRDMLVGLEAVEEEFLTQYHKGSDVDTNEKAVDLLAKHHIICNGLFMASYDFSAKNFENIHRFIKRKKLIWSLFSILTPFKGSEFYDKHKDDLYRYEYKRTGGTRIILRPTKMSFAEFYFHFNMLYVRRYPRLYLATITGRYKKLVVDRKPTD